jgi:hypothetical protein
MKWLRMKIAAVANPRMNAAAGKMKARIPNSSNRASGGLARVRDSLVPSYVGGGRVFFLCNQAVGLTYDA